MLLHLPASSHRTPLSCTSALPSSLLPALLAHRSTRALTLPHTTNKSPRAVLPKGGMKLPDGVFGVFIDGKFNNASRKAFDSTGSKCKSYTRLDTVNHYGANDWNTATQGSPQVGHP